MSFRACTTRPLSLHHIQALVKGTTVNFGEKHTTSGKCNVHPSPRLLTIISFHLRQKGSLPLLSSTPLSFFITINFADHIPDIPRSSVYTITAISLTAFNISEQTLTNIWWPYIFPTFLLALPFRSLPSCNLKACENHIHISMPSSQASALRTFLQSDLSFLLPVALSQTFSC